MINRLESGMFGWLLLPAAYWVGSAELHSSGDNTENGQQTYYQEHAGKSNHVASNS